jgi:hypothetical protein
MAIGPSRSISTASASDMFALPLFCSVIPGRE